MGMLISSLASCYLKRMQETSLHSNVLNYLQMAWYLHFYQEDLFANPNIGAVHGP